MTTKAGSSHGTNIIKGYSKRSERELVYYLLIYYQVSVVPIGSRSTSLVKPDGEGWQPE